MEAFDDGFKEAVYFIRPCKLKKRAEDLWCAERRTRWREGGGVEVVKKGLKGQMGMREVEGSRA